MGYRIREITKQICSQIGVKVIKGGWLLGTIAPLKQNQVTNWRS
jgi:hypothetical protein